jgi:hypothetical protein
VFPCGHGFCALCLSNRAEEVLLGDLEKVRIVRSLEDKLRLLAPRTQQVSVRI